MSTQIATGYAAISDDKLYRYGLWRESPSLIHHGQVLFVMLNPSTADGAEDDATIRRCMGFADRWGYRDLAVANLYAWRATDPADLDLARDPVGAGNDDALREMAGEADRIIVAWGNHRGPIADRADEVLAILGSDVEALKITAMGRPQHPLYVAADVKPVPYPEAAA